MTKQPTLNQFPMLVEIQRRIRAIHCQAKPAHLDALYVTREEFERTVKESSEMVDAWNEWAREVGSDVFQAVYRGEHGVLISGVEIIAAEPCEDCGTKIEVEHQPCPFAEEIRGDATLHWLCKNCAWERAQDI